MSAFRRFDPYAILARDKNGGEATAKDAKSATVPGLGSSGLAALAPLARRHSEDANPPAVVREALSGNAPPGTLMPMVPAVESGTAAETEAALPPSGAAKPDAEVTPNLLRDGRRMHRTTATVVAEDRSGTVRGLMREARNRGVGLWADGMSLVTVEPWGSVLMPDVLERLRQHAGAVIAELRGESRARGKWQVFDPPAP